MSSYVRFGSWMLASLALATACGQDGPVAAGSPGSGASPPAQRQLLLVLGAGGEPEYAAQFRAWATRWEQVAAACDFQIQTIGSEPNSGASRPPHPAPTDDPKADSPPAPSDVPATAAADPAEPSSSTTPPSVPDREQLHAALVKAAGENLSELWVVLIGHGTADGEQAKFNLRGPDISAAELADWLQPILPSQALVVIDCSSASGGFVPALSGPRRIVITATRSGNERNFSRFGEYLAAAIDDTTSDLDKDGQPSLLEAYLTASRRTTEFYQDAARLVTEHPLLDDNADRRGTTADWFQGIRVARNPRPGELVDGRLAHSVSLRPPAAEQLWDPQRRAQRAELEAKIEQLLAAKAQLNPDDYYRQLESLLVPLAQLSQDPLENPAGGQ